MQDARWTVVLAAFALVAAAGCTSSSQPVGPSAVPSVGSPNGASLSSPLTVTTSAATGVHAPAVGEVYVRSQGLYYDTFVTNEFLPMHGRFQKLEDGETDFGPGDPGYLGGRWWVDVNGNNVQDEGDRFFHCPLLGPGRTEPRF